MAAMGLTTQPAGSTPAAFGEQPSATPLSQPRCNLASYPSSVGSTFATDLSSPILEEGGEWDSTLPSPNEPATPSSGRQSQEFTTVHNQDGLRFLPALEDNTKSSTTPTRDSLSLYKTLSRTTTRPSEDNLTLRTLRTLTLTQVPTADQDATPPIGRRLSRSTSTLKRTMNSIFKRTGSSASVNGLGDTNSIAVSESSGPESSMLRNNGRRWSMHRSSAISNSPPTPGSPAEGSASPAQTDSSCGMPNPDDFKKKGRVLTGLSFRDRAVNFVHHHPKPSSKPGQPRRASSLEGLHQEHPGDQLLVMMPDLGTGLKARRMSMSLPDDFNVDTAELEAEYEHMNKLLGRHGKHLGKGATSKVNIMVRKGSPGELYAVKEYRKKSSSESKDDYEKKVKSEFSIAKSLHHPNIVESFRLCTDRGGRWCHAMEYCSEGDLFSFVQKGHLKQESRLGDRLCLFKQLVQGVNYLHAHGIAHRDLKLENLLITKDSKLKITDFGVSEVFSGIHPGLREAGGQCGQAMGEVRLCTPGLCGSVPYIAPEVIAKDAQYDPRPLDVWGSAIIMVYLTFGGGLWEQAKPKDARYAKYAKAWERFNEKHGADGLTDTTYPSFHPFDVMVKPPALRRMLLHMLHPDPEERITIAEVVNNRWVKNIECCQLESYEDPTPIDASKKNVATKKIFCHNHLPVQTHGMPSLGKMPGQPGY